MTAEKIKRPVGRPKKDAPRDTECLFYLNKNDAAWLEGFATDLKFRNRSHLVSTILDRLVEGGFAPVAWLKLGFMIAKRADLHGRRKGAGYFNPLKGLFSLPDPEDPSSEEIEHLLRQLEHELIEKTELVKIEDKPTQK